MLRILSGITMALLALQVSAACNGRDELCSRKYSVVSQIGSHDSAFVGDLPTDNQNIDVTSQLNAGIRFLQGQVHDFLDELQMCHTNCLLKDAGSLTSYLTTVETWLAANPNEVLTLLLVNGDNSDISLFGQSFAAAGLDSFAYVPTTSLAGNLDGWPTLQEMISSGKRLVVFIDSGANTASVNYILPEFDYFFETPYDVTDTSAFQQCPIDRPSGSSATGKMYIVNHFKDVNVLDSGVLVPDKDAAPTTNSEASIIGQVDVCEGLYGRAPKGVLVDWMDEGAVFAAQDALNGF